MSRLFYGFGAGYVLLLLVGGVCEWDMLIVKAQNLQPVHPGGAGSDMADLLREVKNLQSMNEALAKDKKRLLDRIDSLAGEAARSKDIPPQGDALPNRWWAWLWVPAPADVIIIKGCDTLWCCCVMALQTFTNGVIWWGEVLVELLTDPVEWVGTVSTHWVQFWKSEGKQVSRVLGMVLAFFLINIVSLLYLKALIVGKWVWKGLVWTGRLPVIVLLKQLILWGIQALQVNPETGKAKGSDREEWVQEAIKKFKEERVKEEDKEGRTFSRSPSPASRPYRGRSRERSPSSEVSFGIGKPVSRAEVVAVGSSSLETTPVEPQVRCYTHIDIEGIRLKGALLDTGSEVNLIPQCWLVTNGISFEWKEGNVCLAFQKHTGRTVGTLTVPASIGPMPRKQTMVFLVSPDIEIPIIGFPSLAQGGLTLRCGARQLVHEETNTTTVCGTKGVRIPKN